MDIVDQCSMMIWRMVCLTVNNDPDFFQCLRFYELIKCSNVLKDKIKSIGLQTFDQMHIPQGSWHRLENNTDERLDIIEIQYGEKCIEEDIVRLKEGNKRRDYEI